MKPTTIQQISEFFSQYPSRRYKKGHVLIFPGDTGEYAYYLVEGKVKVYDVSYRGDEIIITSRIPPAFFPLSLVINTASTRYAYEASTDIIIHQAPIKALRDYLDLHPKIVLDLLSNLYSILDTVLERMVHYITSNAKSRLIYAIISECKEFGKQDIANTYRIDVNEKELGSRAGLSRETVSREAQILKKMGLIEVHHHYMIVHDITQLELYLEVHP